MRTSPRFHPDDPFGRQRTGTGEEFGIFARIDVIGDCRDLIILAQVLAQGVHQRRFAGADGAADPHPQRTR